MSQSTKKIGYLSAMVFVIGTTIGAGIFFKNGELFSLAKGNLWLVLSTWLIASLGIMALGLSLMELVSAQKTNRGIFEWTKTFVGHRFHRAAVNYNKYVFAPVTLLTMPIYFTMTIEDSLYAGFGYLFPGGWAVGLVSFAVVVWFFTFNLLSVKASEKMQWATTIIKFIPLIVLPFIAFAGSGDVDGGSGADPVAGINGVSSYFVLMAGIPAITFAYDGFQSATALKEHMHEPKKLGSATVSGLAVITGAYLFLTLAFGLGSKSGTIFGLPFIENNAWASSMFNLLIGIGILGIINGVTLGFSQQIASQTKIKGEAEEANYIGSRMFKMGKSKLDERQRFLAAWTYLLVATTIYYLIFVPVGTWGYSINSYVGEYEATSGTLYTLTDFLVNFTSLLIILVMVTSVAGGVVNRKTRKVVVEEHKSFLFTAWFSMILFYVSGLWMVIAAVVDIFYLEGEDSTSSLVKVVILIGILAISFIPTFFSKEDETIKDVVNQVK